MKIQHIIYILLAGIILTSCEKDLVIETPGHSAKLVVNGIQEAGAPFIVHLSRSYGIPNTLTAEELLISDAKVEIWEDGTLLTNLIYRDTLVEDPWSWNPQGTPDLLLGHYEGPANILVEEGKSYELRVDHSEFGKVISQTDVIKSVEPVNVSLQLDAISETDLDGYVYKTHVFSFEIDDTPGEENYYSFRAYGTFPNPFDTTFMDTLPYYGGNLLNSWTETSKDLAQERWGSDQGRDGERFTIEFEAYGGNISYINNEEVAIQPKEILIEFRTANKDAFRFLNGVDKQRASDPTNPFFPSEAIVVPSNIDGGYGAFGSIGMVLVVKEF